MIRRLLRLRARIRCWRNYDADLNRRVAVENRLWAAVVGDKPAPDAEECRELAIKLGVPDEYRKQLPGSDGGGHVPKPR